MSKKDEKIITLTIEEAEMLQVLLKTCASQFDGTLVAYSLRHWSEILDNRIEQTGDKE